MSESTTINLIVTGLLLPVIGMLVWLIKTAVNYFFKDGGFMDDMRGSTKEWFVAQREYMESSQNTQATTAAILERHTADQKQHVTDMARHDGIMTKQALESHECLELIVTTQEEHTDHLSRLVRAGVRACDVAIRVGQQLELSSENVAAIEEIKVEFQGKNGG